MRGKKLFKALSLLLAKVLTFVNSYGIQALKSELISNTDPHSFVTLRTQWDACAVASLAHGLKKLGTSQTNSVRQSKRNL